MKKIFYIASTIYFVSIKMNLVRFGGGGGSYFVNHGTFALILLFAAVLPLIGFILMIIANKRGESVKNIFFFTCLAVFPIIYTFFVS